MPPIMCSLIQTSSSFRNGQPTMAYVFSGHPHEARVFAIGLREEGQDELMVGMEGPKPMRMSSSETEREKVKRHREKKPL